MIIYLSWSVAHSFKTEYTAMAGVVDLRTVAGETCEVSYDAMRNDTSRRGEILNHINTVLI